MAGASLGSKPMQEGFSGALCSSHHPPILSLQTLEDVLTAVFRHPTLEGWFLALEQQALPPHSLGPVLVKLLAARLSAGVLQLLVASAPVLQRTGQLDLLDKFSAAVVHSLQQELQRRRVGPAPSPPEALPQLEALRALHSFMGDAPLHELTLALLSLPEAQLLAPAGGRKGQGRRLNALGTSLTLMLARGPRGPLPWAAEHVRGLSTLLPALAADELDTALLCTLQNQPELVPAAGPGLLDACLARHTPATLSLAALLLRFSATHQLRFELWCGQTGTATILREQLDNMLPLVHAYLQGHQQDPGTRPQTGTRPSLESALQECAIGPSPLSFLVCGHFGSIGSYRAAGLGLSSSFCHRTRPEAAWGSH